MKQIAFLNSKYNRVSIYFVGLLLISFLGFWKSYFSKFFDGTNDYNFYFHFHATMMLLWTLILISQPLLIRKNRLSIHRLIGKLSYVIMPLLLISVLLILNSSLKTIPDKEIHFNDIMFPFRDFWLLVIFYTVAVINKRNIQIHAKAMIATGIVFIEPSLVRFLARSVFHGIMGAIVTWILILGLLITLCILDRKQKYGRWIFRSLLVIFILVYAITISGIQLTMLDASIRWFKNLPLT